MREALQRAMHDALRNGIQRRGEERRGLRGEGRRHQSDLTLSNAHEQKTHSATFPW